MDGIPPITLKICQKNCVTSGSHQILECNKLIDLARRPAIFGLADFNVAYIAIFFKIKIFCQTWWVQSNELLTIFIGGR